MLIAFRAARNKAGKENAQRISDLAFYLGKFDVVHSNVAVFTRQGGHSHTAYQVFHAAYQGFHAADQVFHGAGGVFRAVGGVFHAPDGALTARCEEFHAAGGVFDAQIGSSAKVERMF